MELVAWFCWCNETPRARIRNSPTPIYYFPAPDQSTVPINSSQCILCFGPKDNLPTCHLSTQAKRVVLTEHKRSATCQMYEGPYWTKAFVIVSMCLFVWHLTRSCKILQYLARIRGICKEAQDLCMHIETPLTTVMYRHLGRYHHLGQWPFLASPLVFCPRSFFQCKVICLRYAVV
jgi:hypothetical protein